MKMREIKNIEMCEVEFKNTNIQVIVYNVDSNCNVCKIYVEGSEGFVKGRSIYYNKINEQSLKEAIMNALEILTSEGYGIKIFENLKENEEGMLINNIISKLKSITQNEDEGRWMWGMRGGIINYNNKKYYAITYHTSSDNVKSCIMREDGLKMEGSDKLYYERAVSNGIVKGEKINKNELKWNYYDDIGEEWGNIINDEGYKNEEKRIEQSRKQMRELEDNIQKQMRVVFYANNEFV